MGGVKANWHLGDLDLPGDADPMQAISRLKSTGKVIDLSKGSAELMVDLKGTMRTEARYQQTLGLSCDMKWTLEGDEPGIGRNPCRTCVHATTSETDPMALLCALGRQQEDILDAYYAAVTMESLDDSMLARFEREFDAAQELAEAVL